MPLVLNTITKKKRMKMKLNIKTIIIIVAIIILLVVAYKFLLGDRSSALDNQKKSEVDTMFAIWISVVGEGDKKTMIQNELAIKKDLYDKLSMEEILALKTYSVNIKTMLDNKTKPLSAEFLGSTAYLAQNFNTAKGIVSKTGMSDIFNRIGGIA